MGLGFGVVLSVIRWTARRRENEMGILSAAVNAEVGRRRWDRARGEAQRASGRVNSSGAPC